MLSSHLHDLPIQTIHLMMWEFFSSFGSGAPSKSL
jgi:hypothetical protein